MLGADRLSAPTAAVTTGRDLPQRRGLGGSWPTDQCRTCRFVLARLPRWWPTRPQPSIRSNWVRLLRLWDAHDNIERTFAGTPIHVPGERLAEKSQSASSGSIIDSEPSTAGSSWPSQSAAASLNTEPLPGSLVTVTSRPIIAGELGIPSLNAAAIRSKFN
jgi:hypothetical protein